MNINIQRQEQLTSIGMWSEREGIDGSRDLPIKIFLFEDFPIKFYVSKDDKQLFLNNYPKKIINFNILFFCHM